MNNPELMKWLLKVRGALAEQDEGRRNNMLRAADRFLKERNLQPRTFRTTRNGERAGARSLDNSSNQSLTYGQEIN